MSIMSFCSPTCCAKFSKVLKSPETGIPSARRSVKVMWSYLLISFWSNCIRCNVSSTVASEFKMTRRATVLMVTPVNEAMFLIGASERWTTQRPEQRLVQKLCALRPERTCPKTTSAQLLCTASTIDQPTVTNVDAMIPNRLVSET
jgi:hypothetical protein